MPATFFTFRRRKETPQWHGSYSGFYVEPLEKRRLLAGHVTVDIGDDGSIDVRGDNRDNDLEMVDSGNTLIIRGLDSTQLRSDGQLVQELAINNVSGDVEGRFTLRLRGGDDTIVTRSVDFRDDASFDLGNGDDQLLLNDNSPGDPSFDASLHIATGGGSDFVVAPAEVEGVFTLDSRGNGDTIRLDQLDAAGDVRINGGGGSALVTLEDIFVEGDIAIDMAGGSDGVAFSQAATVRGDTLIDMGSSRKSGGLPVDFLQFETTSANDLILFYGSLEVSQSGSGGYVEFNAERGQIQVEQDTSITLAGGNDRFALNAEGSGIDGVYFDGQFGLNMGGGKDLVSVASESKEIVSFGGDTQMNLASGNDVLSIERIEFESELDVDMGSGRDELIFNDTSTQTLTIKMGSGRDQPSLVSVFFGDDSLIDGGAGFDTSLEEDISVLSPGPNVQILNFEARP